MAPFKPSDPALVDAARGGDARAFEQLMRHNQGRVYAVCLRVTRSPQLAAEATQDAFLSAWRALPGFREEASFDSWVYRIGINSALRVLRRQPSTADTPVEELLPRTDATGHILSSPPAWAAGPDRQLWLKSIREAIEEALPALDPRYRVPYVLQEFEGLSVREIAEHLDLSVPAVKTRVHRARLMLRGLIEPRFRETDPRPDDSKE